MSGPHDNIWSDTAKEGDDVIELMRRTNALQDLSPSVLICSFATNKIEVFGADDTFSFSFGSGGNGPGQFATPEAVAVDANGFIYVSEVNNGRIQKFTNQGVFVLQWPVGTPEGPTFERTESIAVDANGNVYAMTTENIIRKYDRNGVFIQNIGSSGSGNGQFDNAQSIAISVSKRLYISDKDNFRVQRMSLTGAFVNQFGSEGSGNGEFDDNRGIATSVEGKIFVVDEDNFRVQRFGTGHFFETKWGSEGTGPGEFDKPFEITVSKAGKVYVTDVDNENIQVFDLDGNFLSSFELNEASESGRRQPRGIAASFFIPQTEWFRYVPASVSLGVSDGGVDIPQLGALDLENAGVHAQHIIDLRDALEVLVTGFANATTGQPFEWNPGGDTTNSAYRVALGGRDTSPHDYGFETPSPADTWDRTLEQMDDEGIYDIDAGEIDGILTLLEASAPV